MHWSDFVKYIEIAFTVLFPLINPIGSVPAFSGLTANDTPQFRNSQARKTSVNVVVILITFLLIGELLLRLFGLNIGVLEIAGGLIVGNTAWQMVIAKTPANDPDSNVKIQNVDISFMPMAMPILSGPGAIGAVIGLSARAKDIEDYLGFALGIILIGIVVYICLFLSIPLMKKLGKNGINILTKMMGFFILAIAVNLIYAGVLDLINRAG